MDNNKDDFSDVMIPYVEFAENANERTPCILVLDCSGSMRGEPIKQLNTGLQALEKELKEDIDASSRVQLLVIKAYGKDDAEISADWVDAMNFTAPIMEASGLSPIGKAMELALQKIEEQKCLYDSCGITSKRPWIFLISDGEPTDYGWELAAAKCREAQQNKKVVIHAVGTQGANLDKLAKFSLMAPKRLSGLKFTEFSFGCRAACPVFPVRRRICPIFWTILRAGMKKTPRSIRVIATKITGGLHLAKKKPCQDFYQYACSGNKLVAVVSDGAGSAKYGKIGAKVVCETLVNVLINTPLKDAEEAVKKQLT